jgi:hypothetical protein
MAKSIHGKIKRRYKQPSVKKRIEALFLDNIGRILTREQIQEVARDPVSNKVPENWHQRLSELRTDDGYTIYSRRNRGELKVQEYVMPHADKRVGAAGRVKPSDEAWLAVLERANHQCEWQEGSQNCGLRDGDVDPVGGGRVRLTADHKRPHSIDPRSDPNDPKQWQALCGRHQVVKKNYWDHTTGKLNVHAIVQASSRTDKTVIFSFLLEYFGYNLLEDGTIKREKAKP